MISYRSVAAEASVHLGWARDAVQTVVRFGVASFGLLVMGVGAAMASTGCDAVNNTGLLDLPFLGGNGNPAVDRAIAGVVFEAGDVVTLSVSNANGPSILNGENFTLAFPGGATSSRIGPAGLQGVVLTITAVGTEVSVTAHLGAYGADAPGTIFAGCMTKAALAAQQNPNLIKMMQGGQLAAQASGNAISGAIGAAVSEAFADSCSAFTPLENGMRVNINGLMDRDPACFDDNNKIRPSSGFASSSIDDIDANAYAARKRSRTGDAFAAFDKKPSINSRPQDWRVWIDVRGTSWNASSAASDLRGDQVNVLAGVTRRLTRDVVAGVYGGYESFNFTSQAISGKLKGDGGTVGSYVGWRIVNGIRFDAGFGYSQIGYDVSAAITPGVFASGSLSGDRWLATGGLTGDYVWRAFTFEPSLRVYWLTEKERAYTDSTNNVQAARTFETGRASAGNKIILPAAITGNGGFAVAPYAGLYGDYYFTADDANVVLTQRGLTGLSLQGWSGRAIAGLSGKTTGGTQMLVGGEYGGLGSNIHVWTYRARVGVPF